MKKIRTYDFLAFSVLGLCIIYFILTIFIQFNIYISYSVAVLLGMDIFSLIIMHNHDKLLRKNEWLERRARLSNDISYRIKLAGENSFNNLPIGILVLNKDDNHIEWANEYARGIFHSSLNKNTGLIDKKISDFNLIDNGKKLEGVLAVSNEFDFTINGRHYKINVERQDNIVYLTDITDLKNLQALYDDRTVAAGIISLDNYEQAFASADAQEKASRNGEIIGLFNDWAKKYDLYIRGYSEKEYLVLMDRKQLSSVEADGFDIIRDFNEYCKNNSLKMTLSIAICSVDTNPNKSFDDKNVNLTEEQKSTFSNINSISDVMDKVKSYLNLIYNRGGNQAVVVTDKSKEAKFYGGKSVGMSSIDKIGVSNQAKDLFSEIQKSDKVIIMAHKNTDADAFAGSIAAAKIVKAFDKEAYIIFDEDLADPTVTQLWEEMENEHVNLLNDDLIHFVTPLKAMTLITKETFLLICDVQVVNQLISEKLYKKAGKTCKIGFIDHHRTGEDPVKENLVYKYNDTTASSTVELVVQFFNYLDEERKQKIEISEFEASMMLLGIIIDTTNLMFRISANTFEILANLQEYGANMSKARAYLREYYDEYSKKADLLNKIERYRDDYGIIVLRDKIYSRQDLAKFADEIINFKDFKAGFCIGEIVSIEAGKKTNQIGISARSLGEANVEIIMKGLGGGGHFNNAATQLPGITIDDALIELKNELDITYDKDGEDVKVILLNDVKGKGKKGDIVDLASGYANHLIRTKDAILATPDNINELKRQNDIEKIKAQEYLEEMRKLKEKLENGKIYCEVKTGEQGKIFGSVSTKTIIDEIKKEFDVTIDKKKMEISIFDSSNNLIDKKIEQLGSYDVKIQLHKEVDVTIKLFVVESK